MSDRSGEHWQPGEGGPPEEPLRIPELKASIRTVLCPVDGSPGSEVGLAWASEIARVREAAIVVVVVFDPPHAIRRRGILETEHLRTEMETEAVELAEEAVELLRARGHEARAVVVRGDPTEAILDTAEEEHADLIVMGRRGLGQLKGILVGSVSERVARHAPVPVFLA
ncbi:MAG TPA: universal stress protein [Actinomycetota bacterium]|nr:universal stress protein [Actinomycetota bacterium]